MARRRGSREINKLAVTRYLAEIAIPTFEDFSRNRRSARHAFLACVAVFHVIDRAAYPDREVAILRDQWRKKSLEFAIVEMVAHHFKHVESDSERQPSRKPGLPFHQMIFSPKLSPMGRGNANKFNEHAFNEHGMDVRNLWFVIRDAIAFVQAQCADDEPTGSATPPPPPASS